MVEPWRFIVQASAHRQVRTPLIGLIVWPADQRSTHESVCERSNVADRVSKDDATCNRHEAIVVPLGADVGAHLLDAPLVKPKFRLNTDVAVEEISSAADPTQIDCVIGKRRGRAVRLKNLDCPLGGQIAVTSKD